MAEKQFYKRGEPIRDAQALVDLLDTAWRWRVISRNQQLTLTRALAPQLPCSINMAYRTLKGMIYVDVIKDLNVTSFAVNTRAQLVA